MTLEDLTKAEVYAELEALVRSWSWWTPDPTKVGTAFVVSGLVRGLGLPGVVLDRDARRRGGLNWASVSATIVWYADRRDEVPRGGPRAYTCSDPTPLVAALMVCWLALIRTGRTPPPELDRLISDALAQGVLRPEAFEVTWEEVEVLYQGRVCPPEVLARASVELALGHGAQKAKL